MLLQTRWLGVIVATAWIIPLHAQESASKPDDAVVLAKALLAHDLSIRSLQWRQKVFVDRAYLEFHRSNTTEQWTEPLEWPAEPGHKAAETERVVMLATGEQGFDQRGRWYFDARLSTTADLPAEGRYAYDGEIVRTYNAHTKTGYMRPPESAERRMWLSPEMLLGRGQDWTKHRRLGELLLEGEGLRVSGTDDGRPILEAVLPLNTGRKILSVTVDPEHQFAPRRIVLRDDLELRVHEILETTKFQLVDGIAVPVEGNRLVFGVEMTEEQANNLRAAGESRGLGEGSDVHNDPAARTKFQQSVRETFGDAGLPVRILGEGIHLLRSVEIVSMNQAIPDSMFTINFPSGSHIMNVFVGKTQIGNGTPTPVPNGDE
jgi:hypothetical protein